MKIPLAYYFITLLITIPYFGSCQFVNISGNIFSEKNGKVVGNASVFDNQTKIGTITDINGFFKLMLNPVKIELVVISDGYKDFAQTIHLKSDTTIVIKLKPLVRFKSKPKSDTELEAAVKVEKPVTDRFHLKSKK